jgi:chaperonin GroES
MAQKKLQITPLQDRVLVEPLNKEGEEKTKGGIIIPETTSKEKPQEGKVVAVGEGKFDDGVLVKPTVKVGDKVIFSKYGYDEVKIDDVEYYILKEENILAVLK